MAAHVSKLVLYAVLLAWLLAVVLALASIIAIFSGAQLFALGVIGEYLARMHFRMMNRPAYAIREITGGESSNAPGLQ